MVVVTITDGKGMERDLELPADVPVRILAPAIARAVTHADLPSEDTTVKYILKLQTSGNVIPVDRTLESAGVIHGDMIQLMIKPIPASIAGSEAGFKFAGPGFVASSGKTFPLRGETALVGRVDRALGLTESMLSVDVTDLDDQISPSVSRRHAKILFRQSRYLAQDLKSTNGTLVNGHLLRHGERIALQHGDEVQFGDVLLIFIWDSQETSGLSP